MTYREWRDDITRREAARSVGRQPERRMDPEAAFPLSSDDRATLRAIDAAFVEAR